MTLRGKQLGEGSIPLSKFEPGLQEQMNKLTNVDFDTGVQDRYVLTYSEASTSWLPKVTKSLPSTMVVNPDAPEEVAGEVYLTLEDAVNYCNINASSTNILFIVITKNINLTSAITLTNPYFSIRGIGFFESTITVLSSGNIPGQGAITIRYTTVQTNSPLGNLNIEGDSTLETTADTIGLNVAGNGVIYINDIRIERFHTCVCLNNLENSIQRIFIRNNISIRDGGQYGLLAENTNATVDNSAIVESPINVEIREGAEIEFLNGSFTGFLENAGIGLRIQGTDTTSPIVRLNNIEFALEDTGAVLDGGSVLINGCIFDETTLTTSIRIDSLTKVRSLNSSINLAQIQYNAFPDISGNIFNVQNEIDTFDIFDSLSVGLPSNGVESYFGEGDAYNSTALIFSFDGSTFTNVLSDVIEIGDGNSYTFPNNNVNTALYFSNIFVRDFYGLHIVLNGSATLGTGDIVFEYWDGTAWTEFNHMITKSSDDYLSYANSKFDATTAGDYDIRFDFRINEDWALNDPISSGTNRYWMRIRISSAITTSPEFNFISLIPNSTKMSEDGFIQYFGSARPLSLIPISASAFSGKSIDRPDDVDIYVSDGLFKGGNQNSFRNNKTDSVGVSLSTPFVIDTSCPLILRLLYSSTTSPTATGNIQFRVDYGFVDFNNLLLYSSDSQSPTTGPNQVTINKIATVNSGDGRKVLDLKFDLEIPETVSQRIVNGQSEIGDIIFIQISRDGGAVTDTFNGDIQVIETEFVVVKAREGGHIKSEIL